MTKKLAKRNDRREMFCREYLVDLNATQAAIRAGYVKKSADVEGARLLVNAKVQQRIQELMDERKKATGITAERVMKEIERLAFVDPVEVAKYKITKPEDLHTLPEDIRRAIVGWKWDRFGNMILQFADKKGSLELYGRHLKLFTDKVDLTTPGGNTLLVAIAQMTPEEAARAYQNTLKGS